MARISRKIVAAPIDVEGDFDREQGSLMDSLRSSKRKRYDSDSVSDSSMKRMDLEENRDSSMSNSNIRALIAGATPLLTGYLSGHTGSGVEIAAKALIDEDQRAMGEQGDLLDAFRKSTARSKAGADRMIQVKNPETGEITWEWASKSEGSRAPDRRRSEDETVRIHRTREQASKDIVGKGKQIVESPEGEKILIDKSDPLAQERIFEQTEEGITPKFEKVLDKRYDKLQSRNKKDIDSYRTAVKGYDLASSKGIMPQRIALNMAVKITEQRATDEDYNRVVNHVSKIRRIGEEIKQEKDGKVVARKIKEANELFGRIIKLSGSLIKEDVKKAAKAISRSDAEYKKALKYFGDIVPDAKTRIKTSPSTGIEDMSDEDIDARINQLRGE